METVSFTKMEDGTAEEYAFLTPLYNNCLNGVSDTLLKLLKQMQGDKLGYKIDRYTHSLQSASRAERDGADEETIVCTLLHDIGDLLAPQNHSQVAASILRPYISEQNFWILKHHGLFQGYYYFHHLNKDRNVREKFKIIHIISHVWIFATNGINVHSIRITTLSLWNILNRW